MLSSATHLLLLPNTDSNDIHGPFFLFADCKLSDAEKGGQDFIREAARRHLLEGRNTSLLKKQRVSDTYIHQPTHAEETKSV
jgi:hypothetical protein